MGKIELDHTGAGSGVTLSSDGTDLLLNGTAIGGGGGSALELYAENPVTPTAPSATGTNAVAIGENARATGDRGMAFGSESLASGTNSIALGRAATSSGLLSNAMGFGATAGAQSSFAMGYGAITATGLYSTSIGRSYASGADSFAAAIANNTSSYGATGANSVAIGYQAKATNASAVCISKFSTASGTNSVVLGGSSGTASGSGAIAIGGSSNVASGLYSTAKGSYGNTNGITKKHATGVSINMQGAYYVLAHATTDATPIALNTDVWTPSATNQVILPNNSAYFFSGTIIARQDAASGTDMGAWEIKGAIRREGSAATTTLVKSTIDDFNVPAGWAVALTADTTNGGLAITVTGSAATNIRWVATVSTSEVTY